VGPARPLEWAWAHPAWAPRVWAPRAAVPSVGIMTHTTSSRSAAPAVSTPSRRPRNLAATLGGWSARHRLLAVLVWIALVAGSVVLGAVTTENRPTQAQQGTGESAQALQILQDAGITSPATELVLVRSTGTTVDDPAFRGTVEATRSALKTTGVAGSPTDPYATGLLSRDRHSALVQLTMPGDAKTSGDRIQPILDAVRATAAGHPGFAIATLGDASIDHQFAESLGKDFHRAEWTAVPLALGILLVVFGALVAAVLPVLLALTAFLAASGLLAVVSRALPIDQNAGSLMLLIGLAVGVDYSLFYLRRERDERARGRDARTALLIAAETSGRSVLISGLTVMVAMAGLLLSGLLVFQGMAVATMLVVLIAMTGSVTVLPAVLSILGDRVDAGRVPFLGPRKLRPAGPGLDVLDRSAVQDGTGLPDDGHRGRFWNVVLRLSLRRPWVTAGLTVTALLLVASPALHLNAQKLALDQQFAPNTPLVQTYRQIQHDFPGSPAPAKVVLRAEDVSGSAVTTAVTAFTERAVAEGAAARRPQVRTHATAGIVEIDVPLPGSGDDPASRAAVDRLRHEVVPATLGRLPGAETAVGGQLAFSMDWDAQLRISTVLAVAFVLALSLIIMFVSFRSAVIAVTAVLLDLLSVGAAYGVMVGVFQDGWGSGHAGLFAAGAIEDWLPLFIFVVLFGLSMDYHVFVVSRIQEAYRGGLSTTDAVRHGIRATASTVTSAAIIMVAVFSVFAILSMQDFQQLGLGLAVAVLVDATVIRALLLPAVMAILGERNWGRSRTWSAPAAPGDPQRT